MVDAWEQPDDTLWVQHHKVNGQICAQKVSTMYSIYTHMLMLLAGSAAVAMTLAPRLR